MKKYHQKYRESSQYIKSRKSLIHGFLNILQEVNIEKYRKNSSKTKRELHSFKKYHNRSNTFLLHAMEANPNLAVLIDGDNIPSAYLSEMIEEITKYGNPTIKRIYGDWTRPGLGKWKNLLLENAITPVQQYGYTSGKNATDSAMIIDAMDILYSERVQGFCIVSSDSDFTRLATRLREAGKLVIGIGEKKTPNPFVVACDRFIFIEILKKSSTETPTSTKNSFDSVGPKEIALIA